MGSFLVVRSARVLNGLACNLVIAWLGLMPMALSHTASAQGTIRIVGTVLDSESNAPVPFVHIYTSSFRHGTISDAFGKFIVSITMPDTLVFSSVGYEVKRIFFSADSGAAVREVKIMLRPKTYQLEPVQVTAYPTIEQFKQDVLKLELEEEEVFKLNIPKGARLPPEGPNDINLNPSISVGGVIGGLYDALSREGKEKKKIAGMRDRALDFREVDSKYNVDVVRRVTNLDEEQAKRFMEWCKFEHEFILNSSEYELAVAMLKCLDEFNRADSLR